MEEKEEVKRKLIIHTVYNIIGFATIFIVFGIFVFFIVKNITYKRIDNELKTGEERIIQNQSDNFENFLDKKIDEFIPKDSFIKDIFDITQDNRLARRIVNPNVTVILRDYETGEILNDDTIGRLIDYKSEIGFNSKLLNKIYEISVGGKYYYRCINFIYDGDDVQERRFVQLLINIDSERDLINNYFKIISSAVLIGIALSILASYILSKKTLKPLEENLEKQAEFVQNVSHELRTPLTIIQAKQELLLQEPNAKIIDKSEDIILTLNETNRLTKLIKDLMILSRAEGKKISLQKESVNIDDYIREVILPYNELAEMQNKKIEFDLNYNLDIEVDTSRFYQLLVILIDNSLKYTEPNDVIEIKTYQKDNKFVLEVKDTGIGVSDEGLKRIFERFYREDKARSRETGGTGLGLSIANLIVSAHGGTIKASHNEPKGTVFTVKLSR